jgi:hypothetical protein
VKVLVAPDLAAARDWVGPVAELARGLDRNMDVTLGIALPTQLLDRPPAALQQATEGLRLDVLLTEAPISVEGWQRLLAGATTYLSISPRPDLISLARGVGVDVQIPA